MNSLDTYRFRLALLNAGLVPVPLYLDGRPAVIPSSHPSEAGVRSWATLYERATQTGVLQDGRITVVTEIPESRQVRERTKNQQRKEAKRRAEGRMVRSEWLKAHSAPPWAESGMSKSAWYRARKAGKGAAEG